MTDERSGKIESPPRRTDRQVMMPGQQQTDRRSWRGFAGPVPGVVLAGAWLFFAPFAALLVNLVSRLKNRPLGPASLVPVLILAVGTVVGGALLVRTTLRFLSLRARGKRRAA
jgi:hypothetical protein